MVARRRARGGVVHFPPREARCYQLVFGGPAVREWPLLDPSELAERTMRWLDGRTEPQTAALIGRLVDRGEAVRLDAIERPAGPALPPVVAPAGLGAAAARLDAATDVLRVEARNPPTPGVGYPGLWCAIAVAGAASAEAGGVWFDAVALRVRDVGSTPSLGSVRMGEHLLLTQSGTRDVVLTTRGLSAFGLPELAIAGAPGPLAPAAGLVLQGLAQRLVEGLVDDLRDGATGVLPHELVVTSGHVARAAPGARPREGAAVRLRLEHRAGTDDLDDHLEVEPAAADATRERSEWVRLVLADLVAT